MLRDYKSTSFNAEKKLLQNETEFKTFQQHMQGI
jgi:hypothetical protein